MSKYLQQKRNNAQYSSKSRKWSHFPYSWACLDAENGVYSIRRVKCNGNSVKTQRYSQQNRYNPQFSSKSSKWSHFSHRSLCFDDETGVHIIRRVKCDGNSVKTQRYSQQNRYNPQFSSKSSKWSHFSHRSLCFDDETGVYSIRRVKCNGNSV